MSLDGVAVKTILAGYMVSEAKRLFGIGKQEIPGLALSGFTNITQYGHNLITPSSPEPSLTSGDKKLRKNNRNWNLLERLDSAEPWGIPIIDPCTAIPKKLIAFSEAASKRSKAETGTWIHFYEDDYKFERLWKHPERYINRLREFGGIISPDFSTYANMPAAEKLHSVYRNQLLGSWAQHEGIPVIANVRMCGPYSDEYALAGIPCGSTLAIGLHGCVKNPANRAIVKEEIRHICETKQPTAIVAYGSESGRVLDPARERDIAVYLFERDFRTRSVCRQSIFSESNNNNPRGPGCSPGTPPNPADRVMCTSVSATATS